MGQLLLGGLVTLAVTFVVQVFVIPRVQSATRRLERWETDVRGLAALLEEELPRALDGYKWAAYGHRLAEMRIAEATKRNEEVDDARVTEFLSTKETEMRQANEALGQQMARVKRLTERVKLVNPDATYWGELNDSWRSLRIAMLYVEERPSREPTVDEEKWWNAWDGVDRAHKLLVKKINEIADPMKPPARHAVRRFREKVRRSIHPMGEHD